MKPEYVNLDHNMPLKMEFNIKADFYKMLLMMEIFYMDYKRISITLFQIGALIYGFQNSIMEAIIMAVGILIIDTHRLLFSRELPYFDTPEGSDFKVEYYPKEPKIGDRLEPVFMYKRQVISHVKEFIKFHPALLVEIIEDNCKRKNRIIGRWFLHHFFRNYPEVIQFVDDFNSKA